jgi:hypothetical protein
MVLSFAVTAPLMTMGNMAFGAMLPAYWITEALRYTAASSARASGALTAEEIHKVRRPGGGTDLG